jgi:hypothetical protein
MSGGSRLPLHGAIVLKVGTITPSNLKQRIISTEELSCFRQVLVVANTGSYGKCINSGLATEAMNGFVCSNQGYLRGTGSASRRFQAAGRREFSLAGVGTL